MKERIKSKKERVIKTGQEMDREGVIKREDERG